MNRETGSLIYEEKDGSLLLAEADAMSKQVEEFPYFRPVDGEAQTAQIKTVDGVKQKVLETAREYDRMLYHTRLSLKFNEPAGQVKWLFSCSHWLSDIKIQIVPFENTQERAKNILLNFGKEIDVCGCIFDEALFGLGGFAWRAFYVDAAGMEHSGG